MDEFKENFNGKEDMTLGVSEVKKRFPGVSKAGKKWRARIRHPKLKYDIYLGFYNTPEEAALVVKKKKAEFGETFKGENSMNVETCSDKFEGKKLSIGVCTRGHGTKQEQAEFEETCKSENSTNVETCSDNFEGKKLPIGVRRRGHGSWDARIWHPKLMYHVSLGSYSTPEEAAIAVNNKRFEFLKMYCWTNRKRLKDSDILEKSNNEVIPTSEISDELAGVEFDELDAKRKRVEFNGLEFRPNDIPGLEDNVGPVKMECADNLNKIAVDGKSDYAVASVPDKLECKFVQCSPTSVFEPENSNSADIGNEQKTVSVFDFEEATRMGIINEYGQLVGEYSELDEHMAFSLPGE